MDLESSSDLVFYVNGQKIIEHDVDPRTTLLHHLRYNLGLTGTKLGCGEGGCGACTVMVSKYDRINKKIKHYSVVSCLVPLCSLHRCAVTTTEGIGSVKNGLHPIQERLATSHGTQCGFCSPGMVMSMYTLLRNNPQPSTEDVEMAIQGNLCRCTGYRGILDGFLTFTKDVCEMGEKCCKNKKMDGDIEHESPKLVDTKTFKPLDQTQELIFPPELQNSDKYDNDSLMFHGERITWYRATSLQHVMDLKQQHPEAILASGYTKTGKDMNSRYGEATLIVSMANVPELLGVSRTDKGVRFGAAVTISNLAAELKEAIQDYPAHQTKSYVAIVEMLKRFSGNQIRNMATVGGSIMTASATSDLNPLLVAFGAVVEVVSQESGKRKIPMSCEGFFSTKGNSIVRADDIVLSVFIPVTEKNQYCSAYKQAKRRDAAVANVNAGMRVMMVEDSYVVKDVILAYGGMGQATVIASETKEYLIGKRWEDEMLPGVYKSLVEELSLPETAAVGESKQYKQIVALHMFFKFYLTVSSQLQEKDTTSLSAAENSRPRAHISTQTFQEVSPGQLSDDPVGRPIVHMSALQHTTGETQYIDDIPQRKDELFMSFVRSSSAHATIKNVDVQAALSEPGVRAYVDHTDVPGTNLWGLIEQDEELFASDKVLCQGQAIGAILADTKEQAQRAAKMVQVQYDELEPILTIQEAIQSESYLGPPMVLTNGDTDAGFKQSNHVIEGECDIGGQVHFYMETQSALVVPARENDEMEVFASAQSPTGVQTGVANALGVPRNRVAVRVKRLGGGFGGKDTRAQFYATCTAVAAQKVGRPVRCVLDRDEDMVMTGTRHQLFAKYKVGVTTDGKILALQIEIYLNGGMSLDYTGVVRTHALFHAETAYTIPNVRFTGHMCRTNIPSNTAFRGVGLPQMTLVAESWISDIASKLAMSPEQVREINLKQEGDYTFYGLELTACHVEKCWECCGRQSEYQTRKLQVEAFNSETRWKKRGITMIPFLTAMNFHEDFLNQGGALVHVYTDGSVLLNHGGVDMGQGLHTKMIQVASRALGISTAKILITESGTNTVPNSSPTNASAGSDFYGMAVLYACETICQRLAPVKETNPNGSWEEWISAAYFQRISLSATGYYKMPGSIWLKDHDFVAPYFTYGAACSEVEIDCLTGDHRVLRADIVFDVGQSLNPAIDIGQIEGAFVQGYGMVMLEEIQRTPSGDLHTRGPGTYLIPTAGNIPEEFNVTLLKGSSNKKAVYSSKGVGEPPFPSAMSVFHAVKEAIRSARADAGHHGNFRLDSPATPERIRLACEDQFTEMVSKTDNCCSSGV